MNDNEREKSTGPRSSAPRPMPRIKSELDILYDELGGPADGVAIDVHHLEMYCSEYPSDRVLPILLQYQPDENCARRHWPWAAYAIGQYAYETKELTKYSDEPTPKQVEELLSGIAQAAHDLFSGLHRLHDLSYRLGDAAAPHRRGHIGWLDAFVSQAMAGVPSNRVNRSGQHLLMVENAKMEFLKRVEHVHEAANAARKRVDKKLLNRERGQANPAFLQFVRGCGAIWTNLTDRKPSADKIHRNDREDPDFVIFVQRLARVAQAPEPTRPQVATCIRKLAPPTTKQKFS